CDRAGGAAPTERVEHDTGPEVVVAAVGPAESGRLAHDGRPPRAVSADPLIRPVGHPLGVGQHGAAAVVLAGRVLGLADDPSAWLPAGSTNLLGAHGEDGAGEQLPRPGGVVAA